MPSSWKFSPTKGSERRSIEKRPAFGLKERHAGA
jgi:hypothetical protein